MKSKRLLLTLLMALLVPWVAQAQTSQTLTVHDKTNTSSYVPFWGTWADQNQQCEMLYPASELVNMAGGTISKLHYYSTGTSSIPSTPGSNHWDGTCQIYILELPQTVTSISAFHEYTNSAVVYNAAIELVDGEMDIDFTSSPYTYAGGNLLIGFAYTTGGNYCSVNWYGETKSGASIYKRSGQSSVQNGNFLPKTTFTYEPSPYTMPANLNYVNINPSTTNLTWETPVAEPTLTGYRYSFKKSTDTDWPNDETLSAEATEHQLNMLEANTVYNFRVKAVYDQHSSVYATVSFTTLDNCMTPENLTITDVTWNSATFNWTEGFGNGEWKLGYKTGDAEFTYVDVVAADLPLTLNVFEEQKTYNVVVYPLCDPEKTITDQFTTKCEPIDITAAPYNNTWSEDFTNYSNGNFSDPCWENKHIAGSSTSVFTINASNQGYTKVMCLPDQQIGNMTKLRLPGIILPNSNYQFAIDVYRSNSTYSLENNPYEGIRIYASTNGEIEGATELAFIPRQFDEANGSIPAVDAVGWYTYELPIGMSGTCYIILRGESRYCTSTYMDNFIIEPILACGRPANPVASNVTNYSATIAWEAPEGQSAWQIAYKAGADFDPTDAESGAEIIDVEDNPYTFVSTLEANTHYYMYVRSNCGDDGYSKWSKKNCNFTTLIANPAPTNLHVTSVTPNSFFLAWNAAAGDFLANYDVYVTTSITEEVNDDTEPTYSTTGNVNLMNVTGMTDNTLYYCYVRANHVRNEVTTHSYWTNYCQVYTPEKCPMPTGLAAIDASPNSITLTWVEGAEWQYEWYIAYSTDPEFDPEQMDPSLYVNVYGNNPIPFEVPNLESNTTYYFKVKGHCTGDYGYSEWTDAVSETTLISCPVPTDLAAAVDQNNVTLTWTGFNDEDGYTVQYRTAADTPVLASADFENGLPTGWTIIDYDGDGYNWYATIEIANSGTGSMESDSYVSSALTPDNWMITNKIELGPTMSIYARHYSSYPETFGIFYSLNDFDATNFDPSLFIELGDDITTTQSFEKYTRNLPTNAIGKQGYIAIRHYNSSDQWHLFIDDFTMYGEDIPEGEWQTVEGTVYTTSKTLNLDYGVKYEARVKANCNDEYSESVIFRTRDLKVFTTAGEWNIATNWTPAGVPTIEDNVSVTAAAIIPINVVAEANIITVATTGSITIADGGQLMNNNNITATVEKNITGYGDAEIDGYYLIANPTTSNVYPDAAGLIEGEYDLYEWYSSYEGAEWRNYKHNEFSSLNTTDGYLYANQADVTLSFLGTVRSSLNKKSTSVYVNNNTWGAWNLLGNPFVCNAYLVDNQGNALPYIILNGQANADGNYFENIANGAAIAPATGIFYEAPAYGQVYFTREAPAAQAQLNLMVNQGRGMIDNAVIRFGEGQEMSKFSFRESSTKIYMPVYGKDYAIVNAGNVGEMPVNFKAEKNGSYTLSFTSQEVSFSYLRLIDNMTGIETNLLETPYYSFNAQTTDYASRFRLVFATGSSVDGDSFAFINGMGNLSIFGIEGEATVQVMDALGRMVSSNTFSGSFESKLNVAPGVYMIRLINGNDVKVQKIVVK